MNQKTCCLHCLNGERFVRFLRNFLKSPLRERCKHWRPKGCVSVSHFATWEPGQNLFGSIIFDCLWCDSRTEMVQLWYRSSWLLEGFWLLKITPLFRWEQHAQLHAFHGAWRPLIRVIGSLAFLRLKFEWVQQSDAVATFQGQRSPFCSPFC